MTRQETTNALEALRTTCQAVDAQLDALGALVGLDGPLADAVWRMQSAYIAAVAREAGDPGSWVEWWAIETRWGAKCSPKLGDRALGATVDGREFAPTTARKMAELLEAVREK
jgi:hypothetical protein